MQDKLSEVCISLAHFLFVLCCHFLSAHSIIYLLSRTKFSYFLTYKYLITLYTHTHMHPHTYKQIPGQAYLGILISSWLHAYLFANNAILIFFVEMLGRGPWGILLIKFLLIDCFDALYKNKLGELCIT